MQVDLRYSRRPPASSVKPVRRNSPAANFIVILLSAALFAAARWCTVIQRRFRSFPARPCHRPSGGLFRVLFFLLTSDRLRLSCRTWCQKHQPSYGFISFRLAAAFHVGRCSPWPLTCSHLPAAAPAIAQHRRVSPLSSGSIHA